jgi:diacylglycerol kinase (ATP)
MPYQITESQAQTFSISKLAKSFVYAFAGLRKFIVRERNARLHLLATVIVVLLSFFLAVSASEKIELWLVIGMVWISEMFNSCLEKLIDFLTLEKYPPLGLIKDMAAGAVLVASLVASTVGLFIFIPKIL